MRASNQQFPSNFKSILGIILGLSFGHASLANAESPDTTLSGLQVYNEVCVACHAPPGIGGAPALGDHDAWAPRITQGTDTLNEHALNGYSGDLGIMPKKGGRLDLSDEDIIRAVTYMVDQVTQ